MKITLEKKKSQRTAFVVRMDSKLLEKLKKKAEVNGLSLNELICVSMNAIVDDLSFVYKK